MKVNAECYDKKQGSRLVSGSPVFYGWVIVLAGTLGVVFSGPGFTSTISVFTEHFITDLGLSRSLISTLYTGGTLVASLMLPRVGRQIDRRGSRVMVGWVGALFGLTCIYMGQVRGAVMLGIGFVALRLLGQGSMSMVCQNVINQWWVRRRGLVMGISGVLSALLGTGGVPILFNWMIPRYGWRGTYSYVGLALLLVLIPLLYFLFRDRPEQYHLLPDGATSPEPDDDLIREIDEEENWTLQEALRTPAFWIISLGAGLGMMLMAALFFHMVSLFADNGLDASVAASIFLPISLVTAAVMLIGGVLADRIPPRILLVVGLVTLSAVLFLGPRLSNVEMALVFGALLGVSSGLNRVVTSVVWAKYYGRRDLGSILGVASTISVLGSALGPMPLGIARDLMGSYAPVLTISAIFPLVLAVLTGFLRKPKKPTSPVFEQS